MLQIKFIHTTLGVACISGRDYTNKCGTFVEVACVAQFTMYLQCEGVLATKRHNHIHTIYPASFEVGNFRFQPLIWLCMIGVVCANVKISQILSYMTLFSKLNTCSKFNVF